MKTPTLKVTIGDTKWKVKLLTPERYVLEMGDDSDAITDTGTKIMYFKTDVITDVNVRHEMFHAYFTLAMVDSSDIDRDATEEVAASLIGKHGEQLITNSRRVFTWLQQQGKKYGNI